MIWNDRDLCVAIDTQSAWQSTPLRSRYECKHRWGASAAGRLRAREAAPAAPPAHPASLPPFPAAPLDSLGPSTRRLAGTDGGGKGEWGTGRNDLTPGQNDLAIGPGSNRLTSGHPTKKGGGTS